MADHRVLFKQRESHDGEVICTRLKLHCWFAIQSDQWSKQVSHSLSGVTARLKLGGILLRSSSLT